MYLSFSVIQLNVQDYDAILNKAKHLRFGEDRDGYILYRISDLPEAKSRMKAALKERIRELCGAYIALSSYVPDEDADYIAGLYGKPEGRRVRRIFKKMLKEMRRLTREIREFDPFELPTATTRDALDS